MSTYTVQRGDNLSKIASQYGTTWQNLYSANRDVIGNNPNLIYSGTVLTIPGTEPVSQPVVSQPAATKPAVPTKTTQQLAEEYAKAQTANVGNETAQLLAQYEKIAEQQKNALAQNRQLSENRINAQRDDVLQAYNDNARQAYINSMLGKKSVEQQLSQAGLNTSGLLGSAYANVENAYGNNLASLQNSRDKSINDINRQLNENQLAYAAKESELLSNIENARLELQKYGNELAYKKYQDALSNYMNFANYDYTKEKDERDYNYRLERDRIADEQWQQEFNLAQQKKSSSGSGRSSSEGSLGGYITDDSFAEEPTLSDAGQKVLNTIQSASNTYAGKLMLNNNAKKNYVYTQLANGNISATDRDIILNTLGM